MTPHSPFSSFDIGFVHVVSVAGYCEQGTNSSNQSPCYDTKGAMYQWLEADLAGVNRSVTPWVVVNFHQPYSKG